MKIPHSQNSSEFHGIEFQDPALSTPSSLGLLPSDSIDPSLSLRCVRNNIRKRKVTWARHGTPFDTTPCFCEICHLRFLVHFGFTWTQLDPAGITLDFLPGHCSSAVAPILLSQPFRCPFFRWYNRAQYTSYTSSSVYIRVRSVCDA